MEVETLIWDSEFFGISVGRVILGGPDEPVEAVKRAIESSGNDLVYVFLPIPVGIDRVSYERHRNVLVEMDGKIVDMKTVFRKTLDADSCGPIGPTASVTSPALEALAYASGWCSRYSKDERLRPSFRRMYRRWLENDLADGRVFVWPDAVNPKGMATASVKDGLGKIGLVAVHSECCGRGVGTTLLKSVDAWFASQGVRECEVVTQGVNIAACSLYRKSGYRLFGRAEVWHVWRGK